MHGTVTMNCHSTTWYLRTWLDRGEGVDCNCCSSPGVPLRFRLEPPYKYSKLLSIVKERGINRRNALMVNNLVYLYLFRRYGLLLTTWLPPAARTALLRYKVIQYYSYVEYAIEIGCRVWGFWSQPWWRPSCLPSLLQVRSTEIWSCWVSNHAFNMHGTVGHDPLPGGEVRSGVEVQ